MAADRPKFLFDEHVPFALLAALNQQEPAIDVIQVGQPGGPPKRTSDPDLLVLAEQSRRILVTRDRRTMPTHIADHFLAGRHTSGVIMLRDGFPLARYVQDLILIWHATTADEWIDAMQYIPY